MRPWAAVIALGLSGVLLANTAVWAAPPPASPSPQVVMIPLVPAPKAVWITVNAAGDRLAFTGRLPVRWDHTTRWVTFNQGMTAPTPWTAWPRATRPVRHPRSAWPLAPNGSVARAVAALATVTPVGSAANAAALVANPTHGLVAQAFWQRFRRWHDALLQTVVTTQTRLTDQAAALRAAEGEAARLTTLRRVLAAAGRPATLPEWVRTVNTRLAAAHFPGRLVVHSATTVGWVPSDPAATAWLPPTWDPRQTAVPTRLEAVLRQTTDRVGRLRAAQAADQATLRRANTLLADAEPLLAKWDNPSARADLRLFPTNPDLAALARATDASGAPVLARLVPAWGRPGLTALEMTNSLLDAVSRAFVIVQAFYGAAEAAVTWSATHNPVATTGVLVRAAVLPAAAYEGTALALEGLSALAAWAGADTLATLIADGLGLLLAAGATWFWTSHSTFTAWLVARTPGWFQALWTQSAVPLANLQGVGTYVYAPAIAGWAPVPTSVVIRPTAPIRDPVPPLWRGAWAVVVGPSGRLRQGAHMYADLVYTAVVPPPRPRRVGWVIPAAAWPTWVRRTFSQLGWPAPVAAAFQRYWTSRLPRTPWIGIQWVPSAWIARVDPLAIRPYPTTLARFWVVWYPLTHRETWRAPRLRPTPPRGLTLYEWGGLYGKEAP